MGRGRSALRARTQGQRRAADSHTPEAASSQRNGRYRQRMAQASGRAVGRSPWPRSPTLLVENQRVGGRVRRTLAPLGKVILPQLVRLSGAIGMILRSVFLTSEHPARTTQFYRDVAGLAFEEVGSAGGYLYWKVDDGQMQIAIHGAKDFADDSFPCVPTSNLTHLYFQIPN